MLAAFHKKLNFLEKHHITVSSRQGQTDTRSIIGVCCKENTSRVGRNNIAGVRQIQTAFWRAYGYNYMNHSSSFPP